ncbi:hypothetical protein MMC16_006706 [Acarospora aff. strigata]|nr:hypothetical protein [Acarospora aff. strigata]
MKANTYLWGLCVLSAISSALPTRGSKNVLERAETADSDDAFVYTWSLPEEKAKRAEVADADERIVYTWSLPEEKVKA